jgi:leucine dehydrogenase
MVTDLSDIRNNPDFDNHSLITYLHDDICGVHGFLSIHRGGLKKPAFGATRLWNYQSDADAIRDVLRLSRIMTYKSALSGGSFGGAKSVLCIPRNKYDRSRMLSRYAGMIGYFGGQIRTGADVGISETDVKLMRKKSPYFVGVKYDPVGYTLEGLIVSINTCIREVYKSEDISKLSFAVQGLGKTGSGLLKNIYNRAGRVYISDINEARMGEIKNRYPKVICLTPGEILFQKVDVLSPCALGNILNRQTTGKIRARIICGSANCQLENREAGEQLWKSGILYAPDYVVNAGGLMAVVDEYENPQTSKSRMAAKIKRIGKTLGKILKISRIKNLPADAVSDDMAEKISRKFI